MKNINDCKQWIQLHVDIVIDLVRIYLGVGLFIKGLYFLMHKEEMQKLLEGADNVVFTQGAVAHYVIPVHLVGGLLLAIGLLTRFAAVVQMPILIGAIFYFWLPRGPVFGGSSHHQERAAGSATTIGRVTLREQSRRCKALPAGSRQHLGGSWS